MTLGWSLDQSQRVTALDFGLTGLPDSSLAKKFANSKEAPSGFSGFVVGKAAFSLGVTQTMGPADAQQTAAAIDAFKANALKEIDKSKNLPDEEAREAAKDMVSDLFDAVKGTLASGKADGGGSLLLGTKRLTGLAGVYVADPSKVEAAIKKLAAIASKDPKSPKINFNADTYGDIRFHTAQFPVPPTEDVAKVVGDTLDVAVGIGPKSVYFGLGTDALAAVKKGIDKSKTEAAKKVPPAAADLALTQVIEFANAIKPNELNDALAAELAKTPDKDHVRLLAKPIDRGVSYHFERAGGRAESDRRRRQAAAECRREQLRAPGRAPGPGGFPPPPRRPAPRQVPR